MDLGQMGVLSALPRLELAKLLAEMEEISVRAGEVLVSEHAVFLITQGTLQIRAPGDDSREDVTLMQLGPGEIVGEWVLLPRCPNPPVVVAVTDSVVLRMAADRWLTVMSRHPDVGRAFQLSVLGRLHALQQSLVRHKRYIQAVTAELWPVPMGTQLEQPAATVLAQEPPPQPDGGDRTATPPAASRPSRKSSWLTWTVSAGCLVLVVLTWVLPAIPGRPLLTTLLILVWASLNWWLKLIPEYAVALAACLTTVMLGLPTADESFSGFADPSWFMLLGAFGLGAAVQRSGLLYRVALHLLRILPPNYTGQAIALTLSGTLLTPCLPAVQSRITMAGLLSRELSEAMRFRPRSRGAAGLAMSAFLGWGQMRFLFLNGSSYSLLAWGLIPLAARQAAGWTEWFWVALPLGVLILVPTFILTVFVLFREEGTVVSRSVIRRQLAVLGQMSARERITMWSGLAVFAGFILQPLHRMDPSWIALAGFIALVAFGVLDKETVLTKIDWQYLLFYGCLAGLVSLMSQSGLSQVMGRQIAGWLGPWLHHPASLLLCMVGLTILLRTLLQPAPAILLVAVPFFPMAIALGYNPLVPAVSVVAASTTWLVPELLSSYTTFYATTQGMCFDHAQVRPLSVYYALIVLAGVLAAIPYWQAAGLLTGQ